LSVESSVPEADTEAVLKAYAIGFLGAVLAVGLAAAIVVATQPEQKSGLVWGATTYTSKEQFSGYLKSKGLSYKAWLARNPGAAPWEPTPRAEVKGATHTATRDRTTREVVEDWATALPLAPLAVILATGATLILVRRRLQPSSGFRLALPTHVPRYNQGLFRTVQAPLKQVPTFMRERNISAGDVAFCLLGITACGLFVLFVALLASS
jgi:hypothetical protein